MTIIQHDLTFLTDLTILTDDAMPKPIPEPIVNQARILVDTFEDDGALDEEKVAAILKVMQERAPAALKQQAALFLSGASPASGPLHGPRARTSRKPARGRQRGKGAVIIEKVEPPKRRPSQGPAPEVILKAARAHLVETESMLTSTEVGELLGSEASTNKRQYASELRKRNEVVAIRIKNADKYPVFQFDHIRRCVYPVVKTVNKLLLADEDPWGALSWWTTPNGRLPESQAPKELLGDQEGEAILVEIAEALREDGF